LIFGSLAGVAAEVQGGMQAPDGAWRVEVVKHGRAGWYPIRTEVGHVTVGWLSIAGVQHISTRPAATSPTSYQTGVHRGRNDRGGWTLRSADEP
jgi:hypothetical protein